MFCRYALSFLFAAAASASYIGYDCRTVDCVTPFNRPVWPLPSASSIPQPDVWPPPTPPWNSIPALTFQPIVANAPGHSFGKVLNAPGVDWYFSTGLKTTLITNWPDFEVIGLSDNDVLAGGEPSGPIHFAVPDVTQLTGYQNTPIISPIFGPPGQLVSYTVQRGLAVNATGDAFLVLANQYSLNNNALLEAGIEVLVSTGFVPEPVPEPRFAPSLAVLIAAVTWFARRTRT